LVTVEDEIRAVGLMQRLRWKRKTETKTKTKTMMLKMGMDIGMKVLVKYSQYIYHRIRMTIADLQ